jgi:hypothetical protein
MRYKKGEVSLGRGAELAGVPVGKIMTILTEYGVEGRVVLHFAISERVTRPWLGLRFVVGYAGRRRSAPLHSAGKFCDSTRDFLWIVSRCAPEF